MAIDEVFDFPSNVVFCIVYFMSDITVDVSIAKVLVDASLGENGPIPQRNPHVLVCFHHYNIWVVS